MPIEVIDKLKPKNGATFPILDAEDISGGHHSVETILLRDLIPIEKRVVGMTCFVNATGIIYILKDGLYNEHWEEFKSKGGVHVSDTAPTDEDKTDLIWVLSNGDKISLPSDPSDPTLAAITATLTDYQNRLNRLEFLYRGIIDGGSGQTNDINSITINPNVDRSIIKIKRGNLSDIGILQEGEPALALDSKDFFIGDGNGGKLHINSAKNLTEDRLLLKSTNNKTFALTISPEGYMNISEYIDTIVEPIPDGGFTTTINTNIDVATRGDFIMYNISIIYMGRLPVFNTCIIDTLLLDNMLVSESDISNMTCNKSENLTTLFKSGISIPRLDYRDIVNISYMLKVNNNINSDISNSVFDTNKTVKIY